MIRERTSHCHLHRIGPQCHCKKELAKRILRSWWEKSISFGAIRDQKHASCRRDSRRIRLCNLMLVKNGNNPIFRMFVFVSVRWMALLLAYKMFSAHPHLVLTTRRAPARVAKHNLNTFESSSSSCGTRTYQFGMFSF